MVHTTLGVNPLTTRWGSAGNPRDGVRLDSGAAPITDSSRHHKFPPKVRDHDRSDDGSNDNG